VVEPVRCSAFFFWSNFLASDFLLVLLTFDEELGSEVLGEGGEKEREKRREEKSGRNKRGRGGIRKKERERERERERREREFVVLSCGGNTRFGRKKKGPFFSGSLTRSVCSPVVPRGLYFFQTRKFCRKK